MCFSFHFMSHLFLYLFLIIFLEHDQRLPERTYEDHACDQSSLGEEKCHQGGELEKDIRPFWHDNNDGGVEEELEVSKPALSSLRSRDRKKIDKKATFDWNVYEAEEAPVLVEEVSASKQASPAPEHVTQDMSWKWSRHDPWNFVAKRDVSAEPHTAAEEAFSGKGSCSPVSERAFHTDEPCNVVLEEDSIPMSTFSMRETIFNDDSIETKKGDLNATLKGSQAEIIIEDFDDAEKHDPNQNDNISYGSFNSFEPTSRVDVASTHNASAEGAEFFWPPSRPAFSDDFDFGSPRLAPSLTGASVLEAATPLVPTEDGHTIMLKIFNGSKVLRSMVFVKACTRTAILNEARACCVKCAKDDQCLETVPAKKDDRCLETLPAETYDLTLMSLKIDGYDMDLSIYTVENLSFLVRAVGKTSIPRFTLRVS